MAVVTDIADAVAAELNSGAFSQPFEAKREYLPRFELPDMKTLQVTVVPKGMIVTPGTRSRNQHDVEIDVAVQKKLAAEDSAQIDGLMDLVDEIANQFRLKRIDGFPLAIWVKTEHDPLYAQEHMDQLGQFTSVLTLTFRLMR